MYHYWSVFIVKPAKLKGNQTKHKLPENDENQQTFFICMLLQNKYFFVLNFSSQGHNPIGPLFTNEEKKKRLAFDKHILCMTILLHILALKIMSCTLT